MEIAKVIIFFFMVSDLTVGLVKHGENKGKYNAVVSIINFILAAVLYKYVGLY